MTDWSKYGYRVTSPYGKRRDPINGKTAEHTGIDLVKAHKAPIFAFMAGEVVHAREGQSGTGFGGFGVVVAIKDEHGALHCYAHLNSCSVSVGQRVKAGQEIGKQGNTGRTNGNGASNGKGSHLHYEVRTKATPSYGFGSHTDPDTYLSKYLEQGKGTSKMKPTDFIAKIAPAAVEDMKKTGVPASLTIAQAALESGWGGSGLTVKANNLFGVKGSGPAGSVKMPTTEYRPDGTSYQILANFRVYHNWAESIEDHSKLLVNGTTDDPKRYHKVLNADYKTACVEVWKAEYATEPDYPKLLIDIIEQHKLDKYDQMGKVEKATVELNGKKIAEGTFLNGLVTVPIRDMAEALGAKLVWDNIKKIATVNGKKIVGTQVVNERAIAPVREVAEAAGYRVTGWDSKQLKVTIQK
ncbi:glucosaminidase domain-containing protein [Paenibacillus alvei]|uniref:glucosaminidase domain-containing protein n=5 Tax=Paenibacillus alvei TaxID=44250 RepID=UPI002E0EE102|nr:glucosaminidase domain-containing protein [Paenibacillus alvei]